GEPHHLAEIMQVLQSLFRKYERANTTQPICTIFGADHEVIVTHNLRLMLREEGREPGLELILVGDQKVAIGAVPARFVQSQQLHRIDMDDQRQLTLTRLTSALWAGREADVRVRIEEEAVTRRRLAETRDQRAGARAFRHQLITSAVQAD